MTNRRSPIIARELIIAAFLTTLIAVLCGWGVAQLPARTLTVAPHWILIGGLGIAAAWSVALAIRTEQLLAPLGVVSLIVLAYFVARPLQLSLSSDGLLHTSYNYYATPLESILGLSGQEITLFVDSRMSGTLDAALTRAMAVLAVFFAMFIVGYGLRLSRSLATRCSRVGSGFRALDLRWVVAAWLTIGLGGEAIVFAKIGSLSTALNQLGTQGNLAVSFTYLVILNFYLAGLILWTLWHTPTSGLGKLALGVAVAELVLFYALLGSRTLVLVPILLMLLAWNELRGPVRLRLLVGAAVLGILFSSSYLAVREAGVTRPLGQVLASVPGYAVDAQVILNSSPIFDDLFEETNYVPGRTNYRYGGELGQALRGEIPRFIYPAKPESTDITFRKLVWGDRFLAGRPVGAAGEFYRDFGFPGVVIGSLLLGILARALTGLRARVGTVDGRPLRVALFVVGVLLLYQFTIGSYSLVFGSGLELAIPLFLALRLFGRPA